MTSKDYLVFLLEMNRTKDRLRSKLKSKQKREVEASMEAFTDQWKNNTGAFVYCTFGDPHFQPLAISTKQLAETLAVCFKSKNFRQSVTQQANQVMIEKTALEWDDILTHPSVKDYSNTSVKAWMEMEEKIPHQIVVPLRKSNSSCRAGLCEKLTSLEKNIVNVNAIAEAIEGHPNTTNDNQLPDNWMAQVQRMYDEQDKKIEILLQSRETQGKVIETQGKKIETQGKVIETQGKQIETQGKKIETQAQTIAKLMKHHSRAQDVALRGMLEIWRKKLEKQYGKTESETHRDFMESLQLEPEEYAFTNWVYDKYRNLSEKMHTEPDKEAAREALDQSDLDENLKKLFEKIYGDQMI